MKTINYLLLLSSCVFLSACGPLYGQFMKLSEGLKTYEVSRGDISELNGVKNLLVIGPFAGAIEPHHMCTPKKEGTFPFTSDITFITKYNDAQRLAKAFQKAGIFETELYLEVYDDRLAATNKRLKELSSLEIKNAYHLKNAPEMILFGVVKKLEHKIAPLRGVIVDVHYELEFYQPGSQQSIIINVAVLDMFNKDMDSIINGFKDNMRPANG